MPARTRRGTKINPWSDDVRSKIGASMILNRLKDHIAGKINLSPTQVRAAEILLKKTLPDLASIEHSGDAVPIGMIITGVPRAEDDIIDVGADTRLAEYKAIHETEH